MLQQGVKDGILQHVSVHSCHVLCVLCPAVDMCCACCGAAVAAAMEPLVAALLQQVPLHNGPMLIMQARSLEAMAPIINARPETATPVLQKVCPCAAALHLLRLQLLLVPKPVHQTGL